jgi:hypothetical protein
MVAYSNPPFLSKLKPKTSFSRKDGAPGKEILEQVWDLKEDTDTRAIDNFIVRLRRYI